jgi:cobalt-precorrin 5A hydrolase
LSKEAGLDSASYGGSVLPQLRRLFTQHTALVCCLPLGIVVRALGSLAKDKHTDPAVVVVDEGGRFVVSVLAGHEGGANALARRVATLTGGQTVITTAAEALDTLAVDLLG